jgi:hypothetical protein
LAVSEHTYAQPKLFRGSLKSYQVWVWMSFVFRFSESALN